MDDGEPCRLIQIAQRRTAGMNAEEAVEIKHPTGSRARRQQFYRGAIDGVVGVGIGHDEVEAVHAAAQKHVDDEIARRGVGGREEGQAAHAAAAHGADAGRAANHEIASSKIGHVSPLLTPSPVGRGPG